MRKWYWIVLAIFAYLIFLIAYMPASYVTQYIQNDLKAPISFAKVDGTLFDGEASSLVSQGLQIEQVKWQLSPWSLLLLKADLNITGGNIRDPEQIYIKGNISTSLLDTMDIDANDVQVLVPAKTLLSHIKLPVAITAQGRFRVDINSLSYDQGCEELLGKGNWLNASVGVNQREVPLGTFSADLSCAPPAFVMQIDDDNKLKLSATVTVTTSGEYDVIGQFLPDADLPQEIRQATNFFNGPNSQGYYEIKL